MELSPEQVKLITNIVSSVIESKGSSWGLMGGSAGGMGVFGIVAWRYLQSYQKKQEVSTKESRDCFLAKIDKITLSQDQRFETLNEKQTQAHAELLKNINDHATKTMERSIDCQSVYHDLNNSVCNRTTALEADCKNVEIRVSKVERTANKLLEKVG